MCKVKRFMLKTELFPNAETLETHDCGMANSRYHPQLNSLEIDSKSNKEFLTGYEPCCARFLNSTEFHVLINNVFFFLVFCLGRENLKKKDLGVFNFF